MYNGGELRWQQSNPTPGGPYLAYPILSSPQPPVSNDYAYYQIMPTPCQPVMGFYQPFPGTYAGPVQAGVVNPVSAEIGERPLPLGPAYGMASQRGRGMVRPNVLPKVQKFNRLMVILLHLCHTLFVLPRGYIFRLFNEYALRFSSFFCSSSWVCVSLQGVVGLQQGT